MRVGKLIAAGFCIACCAAVAQAQAPVAEHGRFAEVNGATIYFEEKGAGEPLFLLHNFFATAESWRAYVDDWATQYRVIAWDMRGHGRSSSPNSSDVFLHEDAAHDLLALMDHLEIPRAKAVGASSGAMLLLHAATLEPDRFDALVLVGGFAYRNVAARSTTDRAAFLEDPPTLERLSSDHGEAKLQVLASQFRRLATLYGDMAFTPDMLATISARTLIVQGDNDAYVTPAQGVEMFEAIPRSRLWIVPNGGHLVQLVPANREDFSRRVSEFLEGQWGDRAR